MHGPLQDASLQPLPPDLVSYTGVIPGWDQGVMGMRIGEVRRLIIPAEEAFGARGMRSRGIPKDAPLDIVVEVLDISGGTRLVPEL